MKMGSLPGQIPFNESPDLELITFAMERVKEFAQETNFIIHLEYPGSAKGIHKGRDGTIVATLPGNVYVWEK